MIQFMRMEVALETDRTVSIPISYNYQLSSLIYKNISDSFQGIHDRGFPVGKRNFKLFTFSRLKFLQKYGMEGRNIIVKGSMSFVFSTPVNDLAQEFGRSVMESGVTRIGSGNFRISSVYVMPTPASTSEAFVRMLSPVTMYSTLKSGDGRKKTYYYSPYEKEFSTLLQENARKKRAALSKKEVDAASLSVTPFGRQREVLVNYKETIVKGWLGIYKLEGDPGLISLTYDAGLGSKNSEGFGCFEFLEVKPDVA